MWMAKKTCWLGCDFGVLQGVTKLDSPSAWSSAMWLVTRVPHGPVRNTKLGLPAHTCTGSVTRCLGAGFVRTLRGRARSSEGQAR